MGKLVQKVATKAVYTYILLVIDSSPPPPYLLCLSELQLLLLLQALVYLVVICGSPSHKGTHGGGLRHWLVRSSNAHLHSVLSACVLTAMLRTQCHGH